MRLSKASLRMFWREGIGARRRGLAEQHPAQARCGGRVGCASIKHTLDGRSREARLLNGRSTPEGAKKKRSLVGRRLDGRGTNARNAMTTNTSIHHAIHRCDFIGNNPAAFPSGVPANRRKSIASFESRSSDSDTDAGHRGIRCRRSCAGNHRFSEGELPTAVTPKSLRAASRSFNLYSVSMSPGS